MTRKVLIDCDPGIDDAIALCLALFDPRLDVLAVTATEGNASAAQTSRNVQAIIDQLDPPRYPRTGTATPLPQPPPTNSWKLHGEDGLGNCGVPVSRLQHEHPSEKVIVDVVRAHPQEVTLVALGPLTNVAHALKRDPELAPLIGRIIIMGGSISGVGNVTSASEFNIYYDPHSAHTVFHSPTTKTVIPLDTTNQVSFSMDLLMQLPSQGTRAGDLLHRIVPYAFRAHHQQLGLEGIHLHDAVALMGAIHPELFHMEELHGDVETRGEITSGATVFDRRAFARGQPNMEVATGVDVPAVTDSILRGLRQAGIASV